MLSLEKFQLEATPGERAGELIYRVKLYAYRDDEWTICGVIDLTAEEYRSSARRSRPTKSPSSHEARPGPWNDRARAERIQADLLAPQ